MISKSSNLKFIVGIAYLAIILIFLIFLFSKIDLQDLMSYEFIKSNKNIILKYKNENFLVLTLFFVIFCIFWVMALGFAMPLLIFAGFVYGKWWGITIVLVATTVGATMLYIVAGMFFKEIIREKLAPKFTKLKNFFQKNELTYFMFFRFVGGGGTPYGIQNILPLLFDMSTKNYIIATFLGSLPSMFVTVSLGSGIESVIEQNAEIDITKIVLSPDIYFPIIGFFLLLVVGFFIKSIYFKK